MCAIIIEGKRHDVLVESGVALSATDGPDIFGDVETDGEYEFFRKNFGVDSNGRPKLFPSGPTCMYKGKEVPCFVQFSKNGGMNGTIL